MLLVQINTDWNACSPWKQWKVSQFCRRECGYESSVERRCCVLVFSIYRVLTFLIFLWCWLREGGWNFCMFLPINKCSKWWYLTALEGHCCRGGKNWWCQWVYRRKLAAMCLKRLPFAMDFYHKCWLLELISPTQHICCKISLVFSAFSLTVFYESNGKM